MKYSKKTKICIGVMAIVGVLFVIVAILFFPKAKSGSEIAALLKPIITAENQSMDVSLKLTISGKETDIHTKMYLLTEEKQTYIMIEQDGNSTYIIDNILYLENGQAFLISDSEAEVDINHLDAAMFAKIASLYEALEIITAKEDDIETYSIEVSGEDAKILIGHVMPDIYDELSEIESLRVDITARENLLTSVSYSGGATVNGKEMAMELCVDNFTTLEANEYRIPDVVRSAIENVDKESLFCISKDLYRLMLAFADLTSQEEVKGNVKLSVNCGRISFSKRYDLRELEKSKTELENAADIDKIPEMISLMCMEGDISCKEDVGGHHYTLQLNKKTMEEISEMVLPNNVDDLLKLSKGNVEIIVNGNKINSIQIGIGGTIQSLFSKYQGQVGVEFTFD